MHFLPKELFTQLVCLLVCLFSFDQNSHYWGEDKDRPEATPMSIKEPYLTSKWRLLDAKQCNNPIKS